MVNDFLKKYQEELTSDRIQIKEDMDLLETKIKEESKFLSLLEESNETYFKEFTPRDINAKNNEKAEEIRLILDDLNKQLDSKLQLLKFYDSRLLEVNALIKSLLQNNNNLNVTSDNNTTSNESTNIEDLKNSLNRIKDYIVLDPYRAKIDLEKLISKL